MNGTQNQKIEQVTEQTLVIGMDIAKHKHYAAMVDERGRELKKPFPVFQSRIGFEQFYVSIEEAKREVGKTEILVGIEPTGHYWLNLAYFLKEKGIPLVMVNPMHVKRSKELDDNLPTKHDAKDESWRSWSKMGGFIIQASSMMWRQNYEQEARFESRYSRNGMRSTIK